MMMMKVVVVVVMMMRGLKTFWSSNAQLMLEIIRGDWKVSHQQLWPAKPSAELP